MRRSVFLIASLAILFAVYSAVSVDRARAQETCPIDKSRQEKAADEIPVVKKYILGMEAAAAKILTKLGSLLSSKKTE